MTSDELINRIAIIRRRNNENWMYILKLAFKHAPKESQEIMKKISACDSEITKLTRRLGEEK